jgi:nucleotide-binding universal stress UspA family protein
MPPLLAVAPYARSMYRRIIVPLDGSDHAEAVLPHVEELAKRFEADVLLLRAVTHDYVLHKESMVMESPGLTRSVVERRRDAERESATRYLDAVRARLLAAGVAARVEVAPGPPSAAIIEAAEQATEPVIVAMCTHARSGIGRLAFGSVADDVVRNVRVPVFLIRAPS